MELSTASTPTSDRTFLAGAALLFATSAVLTILWCTSMPAIGMLMPGGWTMSMTWMHMPGQTWPRATSSFLGMWDLMMVAMMLPSLAAMLTRYRGAVGSAAQPRLGGLTALVGLGYFAVWTAFGLAIFPLGIALATAEMQHPALARAVPSAAGAVVLLAGLLQFTGWKTRHLTCCRESPGPGCKLPPLPAAAWKHGLLLGLHCSRCCIGLIAALLVLGVMDLRAMAAVTAAITLERLATDSRRVARAIGAVAVVTGLLLIVQARVLG
jgi:predicted metal-binding membrane protein